MDHIKKLKKKRAISFEEFPTEPQTSGSNQMNPLQEVMNDELSRAIDAAFQAMPPKYRAVLVLREIEGCTYEEIAEILGCSKGTVESRLFRARGRLREKLRGFAPASHSGFSM
jgi:RNA polymerase sigma factor (sigma-70 family)